MPPAVPVSSRSIIGEIALLRIIGNKGRSVAMGVMGPLSDAQASASGWHEVEVGRPGHCTCCYTTSLEDRGQDT
jgi:hypothetical protein